MRKQCGGFSFIELVIVLSVLGVMAGLLFPLAEMTVIRHKEVALKQALRDIRGALDDYQLAVRAGLFDSHTESGYPPRLEELTTRHGTEGRVFLREVPPDPFYAGPPPGSAADTWLTRSYQSPPDAPRQGQDIFDVFSSSDRLGSNGLPYAQW